ncbi:ubiquitin fusion degradation protein UFD1-domain-containing protein [Globomyces pollinis-pini]|nr:ubiquitin fusion degradation protein UFD1-domain-containing protein [Globomyces pollinis-pini]
MNHFYQTSDKFSAAFRCYSIAMMQGSERENVNHGGKIILPPSALAKLSNLHIEYPMLFRLENKKENAATHAGVLEFIAEEGRVYLPRWMMSTLMVEEGQLISVENTSLALGKFVKIQPQSVNFLDISDPKAVLEQAFRHFACLTQGDIISISYNDTLYEILVMETKPSEKGISIIETDLEVDFAAPLGYIEPEYKPTKLNDVIYKTVLTFSPSPLLALQNIPSAQQKSLRHLMGLVIA